MGLKLAVGIFGYPDVEYGFVAMASKENLSCKGIRETGGLRYESAGNVEKSGNTGGRNWSRLLGADSPDTKLDLDKEFLDWNTAEA